MSCCVTWPCSEVWSVQCLVLCDVAVWWSVVGAGGASERGGRAAGVDL